MDTLNFLSFDLFLTFLVGLDAQQTRVAQEFNRESSASHIVPETSVRERWSDQNPPLLYSWSLQLYQARFISLKRAFLFFLLSSRGCVHGIVRLAAAPQGRSSLSKVYMRIVHAHATSRSRGDLMMASHQPRHGRVLNILLP